MTRRLDDEDTVDDEQVMTPEQFGSFIKADIARWTQLAKARGIQLDS
ncbi:MAG: hypothetical protein Q8S56_04795 [Polaromonas sp.]|nr:hypothetical protein [Polaromonas sp.]